MITATVERVCTLLRLFLDMSTLRQMKRQTYKRIVMKHTVFHKYNKCVKWNWNYK